MTANKLIQKIQEQVRQLSSGDAHIKINGVQVLDAEVKLCEDESGLFIDIQQIYF